MIFVTVGTQLPFDRLVACVDRWAARRPGVHVLAQIGLGGRRPAHLQWREQLGPAEYEVMLRAADLVVAHAGMGTVLRAMDLGKRLVVLPRRAGLGEHRNDHQLATAQQLASRGVATVAADERELAALLDRPEAVPLVAPAPDGRRSELVEALADFVRA